MATQTIYLTGTVKWPRVYADQMDTSFDTEKFHVMISPDDASTIALRSSGSRIQAKKDEDGATWYKVSRNNKKIFKDKKTGLDKEEIIGPPTVVQNVNGVNVPFTDPIGNGSVATLRVSVYDSKFGKGTQLEAVRIETLVPYEGRSTEAKQYAF